MDDARPTRPRKPVYVPDLKKEAEAAAVLRDQMADLAAGDEGFITDTIEGETNLFEKLNAVAAQTVYDNVLVASIDRHIEDLKARRDRIKDRIETSRALIASAMEIAGLPRHEAPCGTLSIMPKPRSVIVTEEADIPARFYRTPAPTLDKRALLEALKDGETIPGAALSNGGRSLQLTVK